MPGLFLKTKKFMPIFIILAALSGIWLLVLMIICWEYLKNASREKNIINMQREFAIPFLKKLRFGVVYNTISVILAIVAVALAGLLINEHLLWLAILLPFTTIIVRWVVKAIFLLVFVLVRGIAKIYKKMDRSW